MSLPQELRKDIEFRLGAIEKQLIALSRVKAGDADEVQAHIYLLQKEKALREHQLRHGRA